jgi:isopenicillin-N epimerase
MTHPFIRDFEPRPGLIYLNAGTHSICPRSVLDAVTHHLREAERNPTQVVVESYARMWAIQREAARFLGADAGDLFLRPNLTAAMNVFVMGAELASGGEILVSDAEYGATANVCRLRAERDGYRLRAFHLPGTLDETRELSETELADAVIRELRDETRLVMLSQVLTGSGLKLPIERIARETRARGICLAVDGAHVTGAIPLDFSRLGDVDFYAGNFHKWVMGPKGTAYGWVHPLWQPKLRPTEAGWMTFTVNPVHGQFGPGHPFAQKFYDSAAQDYSPYLALAETFGYWRERGARAIQARIRELGACVRAEMARHTGWGCLTPEEDALSGPLLAYELPEKLRAEGYGLMQRILSEHGVQVASSYLQTRWVLRVSPHVYNTEDEIRAAARALGAPS